MKFTRITLLLLAIGLFFTQLAKADTEPNNNISTANFLTINSTVSGTLISSDFADWYFIVANGDGDVTISADFGSTLTGQISLLTPASAIIAQSPADTGMVSATRLCLTSDTLYILVQRLNGSGPYTLTNSWTQNTAPNDAEPNDAQSQALALTDGVPVSGHLGYITFNGLVGTFDVQDYYRIITTSAGTINLSANFGAGVTGFVRLLTKDNGVLGQSSTSTGLLTVGVACLAPDTFLVQLVRSAGCGAYTLTYQQTSVVSTFDPEPNNTTSEAVLVGGNSSNSGNLGYITYVNNTGTFDVIDRYKFVLTGDGTISATVTYTGTLSGSINLLTRSNGLLQSAGTGSGPFTVSANCQAADTFFISLTRSSGCGGYTLNITSTPNAQPNDVEPNNTFATASSISLNATANGHLGYISYVGLTGSTDVIDYYAFNIPTAGSYDLDANLENTFMGRLTLFNAAQNAIAQSGIGTGPVSLTHNFTTTGLYYVAVTRTSANTCGSYDLTISPNASTCNPVTNLSTSNLSFTSVTLNWSISAGAVQYEIRGGLAGSNPANYVTLMIPSGTTSSFNVSGLSINTSYEWQIRALCNASGTIASAWSPLNVFTTLSCAAPSPASTTMITGTTARLNWTAVANASGYQILGRQAGSSAIVTLTVNNGATNFFNVTGLSPNTSYEWAARTLCGGGSIRSGFTAIQTFTTTNGSASKMAPIGTEFSIYPNPAQGMVVLSHPVNAGVRNAIIVMTDLSGRELGRLPANDSGTSTLDVGSLPAGLYQVLMIEDGNVTHQKRMVVVK